MLDTIKPFYKKARRTILLAHDRLTENFYHLFSVIELLPEDISDFSLDRTGWKNNTQRSTISTKKSDFTFYLVIEDIDSVDEAILSFERPFDTIVDNKQINYFNDSFIKEPESLFPLVLQSNFHDESNIGSILPKRQSGMYVWSKIDHERTTQSKFDNDELSRNTEAMSQLTSDWLGFDIWNKSEHIGNIYLSAPNPYFRDLDITLCKDPIGIFYHLYLRNGITEKFTARVLDKRGDNIALDKTFVLQNNIGLLQLPHEPHQTSISIYNTKGDLVMATKPAVFIKSMQFEMQMKQADYQINIQKPDGSVETSLVPKFSKERPLNVGKKVDFNAAYYFKQSGEKRQHINHEKIKEFIFYPGGKTGAEKVNLKAKAKEDIREIINRAKDNCYLCDPYFGLLDLVYFAFHIKNTGVKLTILASKEYTTKEKAKEIEEAINEYNKKPFQKIEFRLLVGKSILHDRFIVADTNVWVIGSSFNEFGNRATSIGKVPKSSDNIIIREIEKWIHSAEYSQSLEKYINSTEE